MILALGLSLLVASMAAAKGGMLNDVNATCGTSYGCGICHVDPGGGGSLNTDGRGYKDANQDPCYFCDSVCYGPTDADGDGHANDVDCNDADATIYPGAPEDCNDSKDNDCNGVADANDPACAAPACTDADGDGYYAEGGDCGPADCNDADPEMNLGMYEVCFDSKDNDCNGFIDANDDACGTLSCTDFDGDGFSVEGGDCGPVDCNDDNAAVYPGAEDLCGDGIDQDCSGKDRVKGKGCSKAPSEGKGKTCFDGVDNDDDGLIDCFDDGCARSRACR